jgi:hypothetical protein
MRSQDTGIATEKELNYSDISSTQVSVLGLSSTDVNHTETPVIARQETDNSDLSPEDAEPDRDNVMSSKKLNWTEDAVSRHWNCDRKRAEQQRYFFDACTSVGVVFHGRELD